MELSSTLRSDADPVVAWSWHPRCPHVALAAAIGEEKATDPVVEVDAASGAAAGVAQCVAQYGMQPRAPRVSQWPGRWPALS